MDAARHPERISGLVLADTFTPELAGWSEWLQRSAMLQATIPLVRLLGYERVEKVMVWLQERVSGAGASGDYEKIEKLREEGPRMTTAEFAKVIRAVVDFDEIEIDFPAITVPTLLWYTASTNRRSSAVTHRNWPRRVRRRPSGSSRMQATRPTSTTPSSSRTP